MFALSGARDSKDLMPMQPPCKANSERSQIKTAAFVVLQRAQPRFGTQTSLGGQSRQNGLTAVLSFETVGYAKKVKLFSEYPASMRVCNSNAFSGGRRKRAVACY